MWGAVLGGLGLISGWLQNQQANSQANKARKAAQNAQMMALEQSQPLIDRQIKFFDTLFGKVQDAEAGGQFDPSGFIRRLDLENDRLSDERLKQMTGAAKRLGFAPGDSRIFDLITSSQSKSMADRDRLSSQLKRDLFFDKINAYAGVPVQNLGNAVNQLRGLYGDQTNLQLGMMNHAQSQMQNPAGFLGSIMPFLQPSSNASNNQWNIDWLRQNQQGWMPQGWNFGPTNPGRWSAPIDEIISF